MDRRQAGVRRDEILLATARVVAKKGFARTRVADVATVLGISSGLVFYHFETKERLLSEAFLAGNEKDQQTLQEILSGPGTVIDRIRAVMRMYLPTGPAEAWTRDIDAWSEGLYAEEIRQACRRNDDRWRHAFRTLIAEGAATGECQGGDDPDESALRITVTLDGLAVASQVRGSLSREVAVQWAAQHVAHVLAISPEVLLPPETADGSGGDAAPISPREPMDSSRVRLYR
jgi:AcrR family transcriptional regulator